MLDTLHPTKLRGAQASRVRLQHNDARYTAQQPFERRTVPLGSPIASRNCAGRRGREGHQRQLAMGTIQAKPVFWRTATHPQEFDGGIDVDTR
jgi:hypothetical protein